MGWERSLRRTQGLCRVTIRTWKTVPSPKHFQSCPSNLHQFAISGAFTGAFTGALVLSLVQVNMTGFMERKVGAGPPRTSPVSLAPRSEARLGPSAPSCGST